MSRELIVLSANAAWNIVNFRMPVARALQRAGYRVVAAAARDGHAERLAESGIDFHEVPIDSMGVSPIRDLVLLVRYWRLLRALRPAVFLGYTVKPNVYGSIVAHILGIPVINNVSGLGTAFIRKSALTTVVSWLYRIALRRSSTVFFQNPDDLSFFRGAGLVSERQAKLLPGSGIDLARFSPVPRGAGSGGGFTFLMVARLLWDKGVGEFVEAARLVRAKHPEARFQLLGFLDVANRTAVPRADVEAWVAEGAIEYLGASEDVRPFLAAADCVVLPSYREGLPRTLLEAAAMAIPLIAADVPGCREVVRDGVNGFLCAVRDAASLADAMDRMQALPAERRAAFAAASRSMAERDYGDAIVAERYLEAVRRAVSQSAER